MYIVDPGSGVNSHAIFVWITDNWTHVFQGFNVYLDIEESLLNNFPYEFTMYMLEKRISYYFCSSWSLDEPRAKESNVESLEFYLLSNLWIR